MVFMVSVAVRRGLARVLTPPAWDKCEARASWGIYLEPRPRDQKGVDGHAIIRGVQVSNGGGVARPEGVFIGVL